ncbi:MAG: DUF3147 family protein [Acidimicrobiales bacterium]
MKTGLELAADAVTGGALVVFFALVGEGVDPKRFSGLFGSAPSIALAGLAVTLAFAGGPQATLELSGMLPGAIAMIAYCATAAVSVRRFGAARGSAMSLVAWFAVAGLAWVAGLQ